MTYLNLTANALIGTLPQSVGELVKLTLLDVSRNNLEGTIPESVGNWSLIQVAWFFENQFTGAVPTEFCVNANRSMADVLVDCALSCTGGCCSSLQVCDVV
jgi:hypothetical protein